MEVMTVIPRAEIEAWTKLHGESTVHYPKNGKNKAIADDPA
jgi:hypothetical protein